MLSKRCSGPSWLRFPEKKGVSTLPYPDRWGAAPVRYSARRSRSLSNLTPHFPSPTTTVCHSYHFPAPFTRSHRFYRASVPLPCRTPVQPFSVSVMASRSDSDFLSSGSGRFEYEPCAPHNSIRTNPRRFCCQKIRARTSGTRTCHASCSYEPDSSFSFLDFSLVQWEKNLQRRARAREATNPRRTGNTRTYQDTAAEEEEEAAAAAAVPKPPQTTQEGLPIMKEPRPCRLCHFVEVRHAKDAMGTFPYTFCTIHGNPVPTDATCPQWQLYQSPPIVDPDPEV